ncbi:mechanosensitive ion channel family protein [Gammaproteobacteria bacterium]|jgi:MscS family membrane protein|nr:mechanosensitive ion channel family protein [Pseudomonadota bacterium]MDA9023692.1 mechanosensitive ion channel family protein [Gammaproteobacteria bacterium]MDG1184645.1 mechanosensitive ion channel family protein [SAR86 cluster bacterium]MDA9027662.1 mechanosensitive ion channel family protein [Gammaproteobacteria bacterium]MDA9307032.1 mechanosensitive ion channel family protein [Gammaproteobacteria bacterium]
MEGLIEIISNVWTEGFLGIGITEIIISFLIFIAGAISRAFFVGRVLKWLESFTASTESEIDDVLVESFRKPLGFIPITISLYCIAVYLPLSGVADLFATNIIKALIAFTIFSTLANSISPIFNVFTSSAVLTKSMTIWLERAARIIIWVIGVGVIFDIFGIQIGPLVAGLGLFSVAVALGAQDLFKNLISGLLIIGENRFQPGDRIEVTGQLHGIVEDIGFRSTLIRMFDTAPMLVPNKDLSDVMVINHGKMKFRRVSWTLNLVYSTTQEQLAKICDDISEYINHSDQFAINPDQESFARTEELGASSIDVRVLCYTDPIGLTDFSKIRQNLIFEIIKIVRFNGSEFAYPSSSLYIENNESVDPSVYAALGLKAEKISHDSAPDKGDE